MSGLRFNVVESAFYKKAAMVDIPEGRPCDYFGKYVFGREQMFHYLSAERPKGDCPWRADAAA